MKKPDTIIRPVFHLAELNPVLDDWRRVHDGPTRGEALRRLVKLALQDGGSGRASNRGSPSDQRLAGEGEAAPQPKIYIAYPFCLTYETSRSVVSSVDSPGMIENCRSRRGAPHSAGAPFLFSRPALIGSVANLTGQIGENPCGLWLRRGRHGPLAPSSWKSKSDRKIKGFQPLILLAFPS
jgi:hypothetical protein